MSQPMTMRAIRADGGRSAPRWRQIVVAALFLGLALLLPLAACAPITSSPPLAGTITFGVTIPITGPDVEEGRYSLDGYLLYINTINQRGGLLIGGKRYRLALDYYDDQSNPALTAQLYQKLVTHDNVNFLLGPYSSLLTAAAAPVAERLGVPMVATHGSADSIYSAKDKFVFSVISPAKDYLRGVIAIVLQRDPGASTVALLGSDEAFSHEVLAGAAEYAQERGMKVVYEQYYPRDPDDVSPQIEAMKLTHPDVVLVAGHLQDAILFTRQAHALCLSPKAVGITVGPAMSEFRANLGAQGNYIFGATQWTSALNYHGDDLWSTPQVYSAAFLKAFPNYSEVPYQAADSTAGLIAFQQALETSGSLDPVRVASALRQLDIMTFYGRIRFDDRGVNVYKPMAVTQLQPDGGDYTVFPLDVAQRPAMYPMPPCMGE
ncbi:MAG TPA: amino acid ABC transporter substrate-binding protein [Ktedonobacterales bacterium]|jgi:branched-chain amino acid transport system substrate-binding protein|nr:amino acid ABC transporter substrate-binding protein [Ktedonobacterales bacterium]